MTRWLVLVGLAGLVAACGPQQATYRDLERMANAQQREAIERPPPDTCQMAAHQSLVGTEGAAIDRSRLPSGARVICFDCVVTMDYSAQRLNLHLDRDGKVDRLSCG